jgi:electron transfer flavoprotein beta subunit
VIGDAEAYPGVPAALAGALGWPALLGVSAAAFTGGRVEATRRVGNDEQTVSLRLPAVLGVTAGSAEKAAPGMKEILAARKRPLTVVPIGDLDNVSLDRLESRGTRVPASGSARIFEGSPASAARELVTALRADGVL